MAILKSKSGASYNTKTGQKTSSTGAVSYQKPNTETTPARTTTSKGGSTSTGKATPGVAGTGYWSNTGWVQGGNSANDPTYKQLTDEGKTYGVGGTANNYKPDYNAPIKADALGADGMNMPSAPKTNDYNAAAIANNATLASTPGSGLVTTPAGLLTSAPATGKVEAPAEGDKFQNLLTSYIGNLPTPPSAESIYNKLPEKKAFERASQQVNDLTGQINQIVAQSQAAQLATTGQGRGIPEYIIGGQQAQIAKESAIQALPLQALLANAQGNKELAAQMLETSFKLKMQDAQSQYDYKKNVLNMVYDYATKAEQRKLDDIKVKEDQAFQLKRDNINFEQQIYLKKMGMGTDAPTVKSINGVDMQWNPKTQAWDKIGGSSDTSSTLRLAQAQGDIQQGVDLTTSSGLSSAVGPSFLSRAPYGFWRNLGAAATIVGLPSVLKGDWKKATGQQQDFIAGVEQLRSTLNLESLINAKSRGATFGALSDQELKVLSNSATKIGSWAVKNSDNNVVGYNTSQKAFKAELDKINNYSKIDYLLKGGKPEDVGVQVHPDGSYWTKNSDGTYTQLQ